MKGIEQLKKALILSSILRPENTVSTHEELS